MEAMIAAPTATLPLPSRAHAGAADAAAQLTNAIQSLGGLERLVVSLYYKEGLRLPEIGLVLGLGELEVTQIHAQALAALRAESIPARRQAA
jgi:DNA-directed RNA polymerase specialized sigma subunit